jgi:branched-chain amino acid transport system substrate-binding protein
MADPIRDDDPSDIARFAPRRLREQPPVAERPYIASSPLAPWNQERNVPQERRAMAERDSWPERVPEPPVRFEEGSSSLFVRVSLVVIFAAVVAVGVIFAKPIVQGVRAWFDIAQSSNSPDRPTANPSANNAPLNEPVAPKTQVAATPAVVPATVAPPAPASPAQPAAVPVAPPPANAQQQTSLAPVSQQEPGSVRTPVRGVTDTEIRFGISAPFSGATKELGQNMQRGIEAAFREANANGGVHGRQLRLIAADDGYEPARAAETMKQLFEKDQVFGVVGNVGTPTAVVAVPYALQRKMLFFGAFTGAGLLRNDPPDRYVFNYRASYAEETEAMVHYLVKVRHLKPTQIAVFAQQDAYGDSGFAGVAKAFRSLGADDSTILRLNYQRNTVNVDDAVAQLQAHNAAKGRTPIKAVIMVPAYRAAAKFIEKTRDLFPGMIYSSVSFVGSTALANELMLLGPRFATGVIVTQVVPALEGSSSLVLNYKAALTKYFPGEAPDYVSLEGYVMANVLIAALQRNGPDLDTEKLVQTLENLHDYDIGLGTLVTFGRSEHQGVHRVWGTQLDANGRYQPIDLQ